MPDRDFAAGDRVEWLHVAATGRAFVVLARKGQVRRVAGEVVFIAAEEGGSIRLTSADVVRLGEAIGPKKAD